MVNVFKKLMKREKELVEICFHTPPIFILRNKPRPKRK